MIDYQIQIQVTTTIEGYLEISILKEGILRHDETIKIGGDIFANAKKLLFIFDNCHLHFYYNISLDDIARFESMNSIKRGLKSNIEYTINDVKEIKDSFLLFIDTLSSVIEKLIYKRFNKALLISILSSDFHGDLIQFLLPLRLSNNLLINSCNSGLVEAIINNGILCLFDGDYYAQDVSFFAKRNKNINSLLIQESLNERILNLIHSFIESTIYILINFTYLNRTNVYFNIGNHDSRLLREIYVEYRIGDYDFRRIDYSIIRRNLNILMLLSTKTRVYLIQHGLISMSLFYFNNNGYKPKFDNELLNIIYDSSKIRNIKRNDIYELKSVSYESIEFDIKQLDETYIRNKIELEMKSQSYNEQHFKAMKNGLNKETLEPITLLNLYHFKSEFDTRILDSFIKRFLFILFHRDSINAFMVLGHNYTLSELPFQSKYEGYKSGRQITTSITKENVIYKNILTLDTESNSSVNEFVRDECSHRKGGSTIERRLVLLLFISSLIICIIFIMYRLSIRKTNSFISMTTVHT